MKNIKQNPNFDQVCVWPAVQADNVKKFEKFMLKIFKTRVQVLEEILTAPDFVNDHPVEGTGSRTDLIFAVHKDDINTFAVARIPYGIRWIEDAMASCNHTAHLYPERFKQYCRWGEWVRERKDIANGNARKKVSKASKTKRTKSSNAL